MVPLMTVALLGTLTNIVTTTQVRGDANVTYEGLRLYQGDMLLTEDQWKALVEREAITDQRNRWPLGSDGRPTVPYVIQRSAVNRNNVIETAIQHWRDNTCINFVAITNLNQDHLSFYNGGDQVCDSPVGRHQNAGPHPVSIGLGCDTLRIVAHEIGHAIGFVHEHDRGDRNGHVMIHRENIGKNNVSYNIIHTTEDYGVPYDLGSVMHYTYKSDSKNGQPTISARDPTKNYLIGNRMFLSYRDIKLANIIYKCTDMWLTKCGWTSNPCVNDGYMNKKCVCSCPPGTTGTFCTTVTGTYYGSPDDGCTEEITTPGTITSASSPGTYPSRLQCTKVLKAPFCQLPKLTFTAFKLFPKTESTKICEASPCCHSESLEIRANYPSIGQIYCGTDILPGSVFSGTSQQLVLVYYTPSAGGTNGRWSADLSFVPDPACNQMTPGPGTSSARCDIEEHGGVYYWLSPNFGVTNYPNNVRCSIQGTSMDSMLTLQVKYFSLSFPVCSDYMLLHHLHGRTISFCGWQPQPIVLFRGPSFNFELEFISDGSRSSRGFNISLVPGPFIGVNCHKIITLTRRYQKENVISPDIFSPQTYPEMFCEYRFIAPANTKIKIDSLGTYFEKDTTNCNSNFLLLNWTKDKRYTLGQGSYRVCGPTSFFGITFPTNELYVAYQKTHQINANTYRGFVINVQAV